LKTLREKYFFLKIPSRSHELTMTSKIAIHFTPIALLPLV
jgi:hypothetical protein